MILRLLLACQKFFQRQRQIQRKHLEQVPIPLLRISKRYISKSICTISNRQLDISSFPTVWFSYFQVRLFKFFWCRNFGIIYVLLFSMWFLLLLTISNFLNKHWKQLLDSALQDAYFPYIFHEVFGVSFLLELVEVVEVELVELVFCTF